jgi:Domain of unknown function (DUF4167)
LKVERRAADDLEHISRRCLLLEGFAQLIEQPRVLYCYNGLAGDSGQNPHGKFYESNGPDVKVRGTASNIAEKYQQLARDAHTSGDLVAAEAYQYAEHYYRLVAEQERSRV